MKEMLTFCP